jgi:hypothetical protein
LQKSISRGFGTDNNTNSGTPIKSLSEMDRKNFNSCEFDCLSMLKPIKEFKSFFKSKAISGTNNGADIKEGKTIFEWMEIHTRSEHDKIEEPEISLFKKALYKEHKK